MGMDEDHMTDLAVSMSEQKVRSCAYQVKRTVVPKSPKKDVESSH